MFVTSMCHWLCYTICFENPAKIQQYLSLEQLLIDGCMCGPPYCHLKLQCTSRPATPTCYLPVKPPFVLIKPSPANILSTV
jgi:hypothetical protein